MLEDSMLKAFITLAACVGGLGLILYLIKRYSRKVKKSADTLGLQILSKITLQPKSYLFIVKAGDKTLLLGAADHNISYLADLTDENQIPTGFPGKMRTSKSAISEIKSGKQIHAAGDENSLSFKSFLNSMLKKQN